MRDKGFCGLTTAFPTTPAAVSNDCGGLARSMSGAMDFPVPSFWKISGIDRVLVSAELFLVKQNAQMAAQAGLNTSSYAIASISSSRCLNQLVHEPFCCLRFGDQLDGGG